MMFYLSIGIYLLYLYFMYDYTNNIKDDYIVYVQYNNNTTHSLNNTTHRYFIQM